MKHITIALLAVLMSVAADAQMQPGFKDFDVAAGIGSSSPIYLQAFDGKLYFYGSNGSTGRELHVVQGDGTPKLVKNMAPGSKNCINMNYSNPSAGMNGKFYFTTDDGAAGEEMYMYDGTNDPKIVYDLTLSADSSSPQNYTVLNNTLYFTAKTTADGRELYKYDGSNTPSRITDIAPGAGDGIPGQMIAYNNKLYFAGHTTAEGTELWSYDPVSQQATMVQDIENGTTSSAPANFAVLGNTLYFSATTFLEGRELYSFDGTTVKRLTDISPKALSSITGSSKNNYALFNNKVYFAARDTSGQSHVWTYDPSNQNVALAHKINPNGNSGPREFMVYKDRLMVTADDGANGFELFAIDKDGNVNIIGDLCPGTNSSLPSELTVIGDELYFSANNCNNSGVDLFSYNEKRLGISRVLFDAEVEIYPNPVVKNLNIEMRLNKSERLQVRVADSGGRSIYDTGVLLYGSGKNKIEVPMRNLPDGNYIYYITNQQGTTYKTGKVVKQ